MGQTEICGCSSVSIGGSEGLTSFYYNKLEPNLHSEVFFGNTLASKSTSVTVLMFTWLYTELKGFYGLVPTKKCSSVFAATNSNVKSTRGYLVPEDVDIVLGFT